MLCIFAGDGTGPSTELQLLARCSGGARGGWPGVHGVAPLRVAGDCVRLQFRTDAMGEDWPVTRAHPSTKEMLKIVRKHDAANPMVLMAVFGAQGLARYRDCAGSI